MADYDESAFQWASTSYSFPAPRITHEFHVRPDEKVIA